MALADRETPFIDKGGGGRALKPFPDDLPLLADGLARLLEQVPGPIGPPERVPLFEAAGRILAEDVPADADMPPFHRATMDGYAVRSEDIRSAGPDKGVELKPVGDVAAGEVASQTLSPGGAVAVATGSMLPPGADAVVPGEWCLLRHRGGAEVRDSVIVLRAVPASGNVLPRGSDLKAGQLALAAGTGLGPPQIGVLAALGVEQPLVFPRPTVAVLATGAELVPPAERPAPGEIRDSNSYALAAAAARDGALVRSAGIVPDDIETLSQRIDEALGRVHVLLISGGSSVGKTDYTRAALERFGADIVVHGLKVKPGKPTLAALCRDTFVIGLPGNPVSALTIYLAVVRPLLRRLTGRANPTQTRPVGARLTAPIRRDPEREEFVRVRLHETDAGLQAEPVPGSSGMLHSMARADGHVFIPMHRQGYDAGEFVPVQLFD